MAEIIPFDSQRESKASEAASDAENMDKLRVMLIAECGLSIQKMYALLGEDETEKLVPWIQLAMRDERRK